VVPLPPGGQADTQARFLAPFLSKALSTDVMVENKAGASSSIGVKEVIRASPDGKTWLYTIASPIVVSPHVASAQPYDPLLDLMPLAPTVVTAQVLVAHCGVNALSLQDLIREARLSPEALRYGSYGLGSSSHLYAELLAQSAQISLQHVPYKGAAEVIKDLVAGHIELSFLSLAVAQPNAQAGKIKILGIVGAQRNHRIPHVPTFNEQGIHNLNSVGWLGFFAPAETPKILALKFNEEIRKILRIQEVSRFLEQEGSDVIHLTQSDFFDYIKNDSLRWNELIRKVNLKFESV
jgi:tripartite-type tricarboxylate transporter receptor subunit TctC